MNTTLVPAYGRDYKTRKAVFTDWEAGKDFLISDFHSPWDGKAANKEQFNVGDRIQFRFDSLRKTAVITL